MGFNICQSGILRGPESPVFLGFTLFIAEKQQQDVSEDETEGPATFQMYQISSNIGGRGRNVRLLFPPAYRREAI